MGARAARGRLPVWRPATRADCGAVPRPCPYVACRYSLYIDVTQQLRRPLDPWDMPASSSCALDVAETGPQDPRELRALFQQSEKTDNWNRDERAILAKLRSGPFAALLGQLLEESRDAVHDEPDWASTFAEDEDDMGIHIDERQAEMASKKTAETIRHNGQELSKLRARKAPADIVAAVTRNGAIKRETAYGSPFTRREPVTIDQIRRDKISDELVEVLGKIDEVNEKKSAAIGGFNEKLKELRERQHELAESHRTSTEKSDVRCAMYLQANGEMVTRRLDTNEVVERRTATTEELQPELVPGTRAKKVAAKSFLEVDGSDDAEV